jgi:uncharacterized protein
LEMLIEKRTLLLGASLKESRYSNMCIRELADRAFPTTALGIREGSVSGIPVLKGMPPLKGIHTVTLYLGPQNQPSFYQYILDLKPNRVIFNPGTENPVFEKMLEAAGIEVVVACSIMMLHADQFFK